MNTTRAAAKPQAPPAGSWCSSPEDRRAKLAAMIEEVKSRPRRVVLPAGTPGPDGRTFSFDVYDDAFDLLFDDGGRV
ncbi:MAG: hypothetical protein U0791_24250 [Gemmataceae bacterium]